MESPKLFTRAEVKARKSRNDILIVIHNEVYDVTKFLEEHPGGEEVLLDKGGEDATEEFEDVSHSSDARALMKKYKVGDIVEAERSSGKAAFASTWSNEQPQEQGNGWGAWVAPLAVGLAVTLLYRYVFA